MNDIERRFTDKIGSKVSVSLYVDTPCHVWSACTDRQGYAIFNALGETRGCRVAYRLYKGEIPPGKIILHECDNPTCVNPDHLRVGTHKENHRQRAERGRSAVNINPQRGEKNGNANLTSGQVLTIYKDTRPQAEIAKEHGIPQSTVGRIKIGQVWSTVTGHKPEKPGHFRGASSYQAKLSAQDVRDIRQSEDTLKNLAKKYGISENGIWRARTRKTYKDVA